MYLAFESALASYLLTVGNVTVTDMQQVRVLAACDVGTVEDD